MKDGDFQRKQGMVNHSFCYPDRAHVNILVNFLHVFSLRIYMYGNCILVKM